MRKRLILLAAALVGATVLAAPHKVAPYMGAACCDTNGRILFAANADRSAFPAGVTKLMTALLVIEDVRARRYGFFDTVVATPDVARSEASWIGLKAGDKVTVRDLLIALMVHSANDAAIALGVNSSGSLNGFIARMNARAKELGMASTKYYNPNGLPPKPRYPWKSFNVTTASDQLKLAVQLLKYPEILEFTSIKTAALVKAPDGFRVVVTRRVNQAFQEPKLKPGEKTVMQLCNHNNIMVKDKLKVFDDAGRECVDGLKTGYIEAGGSSVVLPGSRNGRRVIVAVLGADNELDARGRVLKMSSKVRDEHARKILLDALESTKW